MPDGEQASRGGFADSHGIGPIHISVLNEQGEITDLRVSVCPSTRAEQTDQQEDGCETQQIEKQASILHVQKVSLGFYLPG